MIRLAKSLGTSWTAYLIFFFLHFFQMDHRGPRRGIRTAKLSRLVSLVTGLPHARKGAFASLLERTNATCRTNAGLTTDIKKVRGRFDRLTDKLDTACESARAAAIVALTEHFIEVASKKHVWWRSGKRHVATLSAGPTERYDLLRVLILCARRVVPSPYARYVPGPVALSLFVDDVEVAASTAEEEEEGGVASSSDAVATAAARLNVSECLDDDGASDESDARRATAEWEAELGAGSELSEWSTDDDVEEAGFGASDASTEDAEEDGRVRVGVEEGVAAQTRSAADPERAAAAATERGARREAARDGGASSSSSRAASHRRRTHASAAERRSLGGVAFLSRYATAHRRHIFDRSASAPLPPPLTEAFLVRESLRAIRGCGGAVFTSPRRDDGGEGGAGWRVLVASPNEEASPRHPGRGHAQQRRRIWLTHLSETALASALEWFACVADDASAVRTFAELEELGGPSALRSTNVSEAGVTQVEVAAAGDWHQLQTVRSFAIEVGSVLVEVEQSIASLERITSRGADVGVGFTEGSGGGGRGGVFGPALHPTLPTLLDVRAALERPAAVLRALRAHVERALPLRARTADGSHAVAHDTSDRASWPKTSPSCEVGAMLTSLQTAVEEATVVASATNATTTPAGRISWRVELAERLFTRALRPYLSKFAGWMLSGTLHDRSQELPFSATERFDRKASGAGRIEEMRIDSSTSRQSDTAAQEQLLWEGNFVTRKSGAAIVPSCVRGVLREAISAGKSMVNIYFSHQYSYYFTLLSE